MANLNISLANISVIRLAESSAPGTPPSGFAYLYTKTDGKVYLKDDAGTEYDLTTSGAGTDTTAIHDNTAGEISAITEKGSPVAADLIIIEDSAAANAKKKVQLGNIPIADGADATAIHDNTAGEINAITAKTTPVSGDLLLIEDSADSNNKKKVTAGNLLAQTSLLSLASSINFVIDGGGSAITTGVKGFIEIPFACTINQVTMLADQSGSIVVDIWKDTYANYPPTDADSITAAAVPTISTATKSQDATLTGWTTSIAAGDILGYNVDSATTVTRVTVALKVTRT